MDHTLTKTDGQFCFFIICLGGCFIEKRNQESTM